MIGEHDSEPVPGLPGPLPEGERILWQGAPDWRAVTRHVFRLRMALGYFAALALWRFLSQYGLMPNGQAVGYGLAILPVALVAAGLLVLLGWLTARTTIYTITSRRVVMRFGIALPLTVNVPFEVIGNAALRRHAKGTGDIALEIVGGNKFSYAMLWPHLKPWHFRAPQPMLRGIAEVDEVARMLGEACERFHGANAAEPVSGVTPQPAKPHRQTAALGSAAHA